MTTDYEQYYQDNRHGLGEPTKEFIEFFDAYKANSSKVLDVGCGQGRDALFIARFGHSVTAIDNAPSGIRDLQEDAAAGCLSIQAEVADIREYTWQGSFEVVIIDRTLHMLAADEQIIVLKNLLQATKQGSHVLIADEPSNIPAFKMVLEESELKWTTTLEHRGFLFVQRD